MNLSSPRSQQGDSRLVAVVMAAVQAYLDDEAKTSEPEADIKVSAWRMAVRRDTTDTRLWRGLPWKGSD